MKKDFPDYGGMVAIMYGTIGIKFLRGFKKFIWDACVMLAALPLWILTLSNKNFSFEKEIVLMFGTGLAYLAIGKLMNRLVKQANGNRMPVITDDPGIIASVQKNPHCFLATPDTKLKILCDRIHNGDGAASLGDFFLEIGVITEVIAHLMVIICIIRYFYHIFHPSLRAIFH